MIIFLAKFLKKYNFFSYLLFFLFLILTFVRIKETFANAEKTVGFRQKRSIENSRKNNKLFLNVRLNCWLFIFFFPNALPPLFFIIFLCYL